jgi:hypothetical protein
VSWEGFEGEVQRGVQAAHHQMAERAASLLARSVEVVRRRQRQAQAQQSFFAAKLQQLKRGGAPTTSLEVSSVALDWGDFTHPPGALRMVTEGVWARRVREKKGPLKDRWTTPASLTTPTFAPHV